MRFLKKRNEGGNSQRTTTFSLTQTGFVVPVIKGIIFVDALKDIENVVKMGVEECVRRLKIKYQMDEIDETCIEPEILSIFKEKYPSYFKNIEPEIVIQKRKTLWKNRVCKCGKTFSPNYPRQKECSSCRTGKAI